MQISSMSKTRYRILEDTILCRADSMYDKYLFLAVQERFGLPPFGFTIMSSKSVSVNVVGMLH